MATCGSQSPELENDNRDAYYDIDACPTTPLSLLLKICQPAMAQSQPRPLPIGVMTDRSLIELIVKATGVTPMGVTIMNDVDAVVEFEKGARVIEIAQTLHSIDTWTGYKVVVGCIVSTKPLLVETTREIEAYRRAKRDFQKERREMKEEEQRSNLHHIISRQQTCFSTADTKRCVNHPKKGPIWEDYTSKAIRSEKD